MKKRLTAILAAVLLAGVAAPAQQASISTKKHRLGDFTTTVMEVVLTGDEIRDAAIQEEVIAWWRISPFEFCTVADYEALRKSDNYYFMRPAEAEGIVFLTLEKGGDKLDEVVSIPMAPAGAGAGRELVFLGAMVNSVQQYVRLAMESEKAAYQGLSALGWNGETTKVYIDEEDLSPSVTTKERQRMRSDNLLLVPSGDGDMAFQDGEEGAAASFTVAPFDTDGNGAQSYEMLFSASSRQLVFFHRHTITPRAGAGFLPSDLRSISGRL